MTNLNTAPYYDDFDGDKNFHQILFKPGYAVQARELTQLQTIIQDQVSKFGNHIFKHGSIVIPGNSISDLAVSYVKITSLVNIDLFVGKTIVGAASGIEAIVKKAVPVNLTEPAMFFLSYMSGNSTTGEITFRAAEELYIKDSVNVRCTTTATPTGVGSIAYINRGVYYINGKFVLVLPQSVVISKYTSTPSCHVLLKINEEIVNSDADTSLLDPAQGSNNFAAPGADRVKISLELVSLPLNATMTDDYVEIMRYDNGDLLEHSKNAKYSELEKSLARRTFDESGDYVVNGLIPVVKESLKQGNNNGVYTDGDITKLVVDVSAGKAYINGFEVEKLSSSKITIDKARTQSHIKSSNVIIRPEFGQYIIVSNMIGGFSIKNRELLTIYNTSDFSDSAATIIGTAKVIGIDFLAGDVGLGAIYKLWVSDITLAIGASLENAGGIKYDTTKHAYVLRAYSTPIVARGFTVNELITHTSGRSAKVKYFNPATSTLYAYKNASTLNAPKPGDLIVGSVSATSSTIQTSALLVSVGQTGSIFPIPYTVVKTLINPVSLNYSLQYTVQKELLIITNSSGNGSVSVNSGEVIAPIELGTFVAIDTIGVVQLSLFSINTGGNTLTITGGTASTTVRVYATVVKTNISPKSKTLTTRSQVFSSPTSVLTLDRTDISTLVSVIDTVGDKTANYTFFNGQADAYYGLGKVNLTAGKSAPVGSVTVTYTYYEHSISGDFFCVDSYPSTILDTYNNYSSQSTGVVYDLSASIDFRPSVGSNGQFTGTNAKLNDLVISGTAFNSTVQFYVPRIDTVVISPAGKLSVIAGVPAARPVATQAPVGQLAINLLFISEYTKSSADTLNSRLGVERFTMKDIKSIVGRVERVENFAALTASELSVTGTDVLDATTGLNKFKTGYLVENFTSPFSMARTTVGDYAATFVAKTLSPSMENTNCSLALLESSSNFLEQNKYLMLPFTEVAFASQTLSSRVTNLNPFLVVKWNGVLSIVPPSDSWVDIRDLPELFETKTEESIVVVYIPCPVYYPPPTYYYDPPTYNYPSVPALPATSYGGFYGAQLNREGEAKGVADWVNFAATGGNLAAAFSNAAITNYISGSEQSYNTSNYGVDQSVITSTTTYAYDSQNRVVASTSGVNINGTTFSSSTLV
jgi:hypothetical protein